MPNNDMGKEENITIETFRMASEAMGMSEEESKRNALDLLKRVLASRETSTDKNWKPE
jgi:hypothetical protein